MKLSYIPNFITCLRLLLVAPVIYSLVNEQYFLGLILFVLAGLTDALDGLLARLYGWTSRFGAIADPLADKLLLMSSFITLYWLGVIPVWLMFIIIARDIWIMTGVLIYRYITGKLEIMPSGISKINTFLQILLVPVLLLDLSVIPLPAPLVMGLMLAVLFTSVASFLHYTWVWGYRALKSLATSKKIGMQKGAV